MMLPPGAIPWGDAAGWPDVPSDVVNHDGSAKATHSWRLDVKGRPTAAAGDAPKTLQRHAAIANEKPVRVIVFNGSAYKAPNTTAVTDLAWLLAGTGCRPRGKKWATWYGGEDGVGVPLKLNYQPRLGDRDPATPLRVCAWQPREGAKQETLNDKAAAPEGVKAARKAAKRLAEMAKAAATDGRMVPDGLVPEALIDFLEGIGASRGEASRAAVDTVAAICTAVHHAELTRAREMGLQLTALGLHLPTLLGHSGATVAECAACGTRATKLFHVTTATPKGKCIVDAINERLGARAAESTLNQQQHSGRPPRGGRVVGRRFCTSCARTRGRCRAIAALCTSHCVQESQRSSLPPAWVAVLGGESIGPV